MWYPFNFFALKVFSQDKITKTQSNWFRLICQNKFQFDSVFSTSKAPIHCTHPSLRFGWIPPNTLMAPVPVPVPVPAVQHLIWTDGSLEGTSWETSITTVIWTSFMSVAYLVNANLVPTHRACMFCFPDVSILKILLR